MRSPAARLLACALLGLCCLPTPGWTAARLEPAHRLALGRALLEAGDFEKAVRMLEPARAERELSPAQQSELCRLLALAHLSLGHDDQAQAVYESLLRTQPDATLPKGTSPRLREVFHRAQQELAAQAHASTTLALEPLMDAPGDLSVPLSVRAHPAPQRGCRMRFSYRRGRATPYSTFDLVSDPEDAELYEGSLPGYDVPAEAESYEVEYFVELLDPLGRTLGTRGTPATPLHLRVRGGRRSERSLSRGLRPLLSRRTAPCMSHFT